MGPITHRDQRDVEEMVELQPLLFRRVLSSPRRGAAACVACTSWATALESLASTIKCQESLGQRAPEPHEVTHRCLDCFPMEKQSLVKAAQTEEASSSSAKESSQASVDDVPEVPPETPSAED